MQDNIGKFSMDIMDKLIFFTKVVCVPYKKRDAFGRKELYKYSMNEEE